MAALPGAKVVAMINLAIEKKNGMRTHAEWCIYGASQGAQG